MDAVDALDAAQAAAHVEYAAAQVSSTMPAGVSGLHHDSGENNGSLAGEDSTAAPGSMSSRMSKLKRTSASRLGTLRSRASGMYAKARFAAGNARATIRTAAAHGLSASDGGESGGALGISDDPTLARLYELDTQRAALFKAKVSAGISQAGKASASDPAISNTGASSDRSGAVSTSARRQLAVQLSDVLLLARSWEPGQSVGNDDAGKSLEVHADELQPLPWVPTSLIPPAAAHDASATAAHHRMGSGFVPDVARDRAALGVLSPTHAPAVSASGIAFDLASMITATSSHDNAAPPASAMLRFASLCGTLQQALAGPPLQNSVPGTPQELAYTARCTAGSQLVPPTGGPASSAQPTGLHGRTTSSGDAVQDVLPMLEVGRPAYAGVRIANIGTCKATVALTIHGIWPPGSVAVAVHPDYDTLLPVANPRLLNRGESVRIAIRLRPLMPGAQIVMCGTVDITHPSALTPDTLAPADLASPVQRIPVLIRAQTAPAVFKVPLFGLTTGSDCGVSGVPCVLRALRLAWMAAGGMLAEGTFRVPAKQGDLDSLQSIIDSETWQVATQARPVLTQALDEVLAAHYGASSPGLGGKLPSATTTSLQDHRITQGGCAEYTPVSAEGPAFDTYTLAAMMKVLIRSLPQRLCQNAEALRSARSMLPASSQDGAIEVLQMLTGSLAASHVMLWIARVCCISALCAGATQMPPANMAIVWAPNLVTVPDLRSIPPEQEAARAEAASVAAAATADATAFLQALIEHQLAAAAEWAPYMDGVGSELLAALAGADTRAPLEDALASSPAVASTELRLFTLGHRFQQLAAHAPPFILPRIENGEGTPVNRLVIATESVPAVPNEQFRASLSPPLPIPSRMGSQGSVSRGDAPPEAPARTASIRTSESRSAPSIATGSSVPQPGIPVMRTPKSPSAARFGVPMPGLAYDSPGVSRSGARSVDRVPPPLPSASRASGKTQ